MSTSAEITCTIQKDCPSITFRISAQGEGNSAPDLLGMLSQIQEAVTEFQKTPQAKLLSNAEVVVQDAPRPMQSTNKKQFSGNKAKSLQQKSASPQNEEIDHDLPGSIPSGQIGKIHVDLRSRNIPVKDFCFKQGIARIEDLAFNRAWTIINHEEY